MQYSLFSSYPILVLAASLISSLVPSGMTDHASISYLITHSFKIYRLSPI